MLYFFILGRQPVLSLAEIFSVFGRRVRLVSFSDSFAALEFEKEIDSSKVLEKIGGSIKFGKIIWEQNSTTAEKCSALLEEKIFYEIIRQSKKDKLFFGISAYGKQKFNTREIGLAIKRKIRSEGRKCRFVISREKNLSSVVVKTNKLLSSQGAEFVILDDGKNQFLGKTAAVQEFEEYEARDFPKPARSMLRGMLPPKLAKIMINLSVASKNGVILDPFCGTGTILSEAAILGYRNLIGADNDPQAVKATETNLDWLKTNLQLTTYNLQLFIADARKISEKVQAQSVNAIVTEPYLGPPMKGNETPKKIRELTKELQKLYLESFNEFKKVLKSDGRAVFVSPIFRVKNQMLATDLKSDIEKINFEIINPLPQEIQKRFKNEFGPNGGFIYNRPDQRVWREILVLRLRIKV